MDNWCKVLNDLNEIPYVQYEGYVWYSDEEKPYRLRPDYFKPKEGDKSFIVEACLFDSKNKRSVHIRHVGRTVIQLFDLNLVPNWENEVQTYIANEEFGKKDLDLRIKYAKIWQEEKRPIVNSSKGDTYPTLKLKATVFVGFENGG